LTVVSVLVVRAAIQRIAAGQRCKRLARGTTLPEVKGQGGADRGPACRRWAKPLSSRSRCPGSGWTIQECSSTARAAMSPPRSARDRVAPTLSGAVRERGEPMEIDPATLHLGMTMRRVELAPERPDRQQQMTGERGVKPAHGKGRRFQRGDPITVGKPSPTHVLCSSSTQGADHGVRRMCPSRLPPDGPRSSIMRQLLRKSRRLP
jgi:hypothetical protein